MKLTNLKVFALVTGTATLLLSGVSSANAFTLFTNRAAWEAAITGSNITTDTFSNLIPSAQSITFDSGIVSTNSLDVILPNAFNNNSVSIIEPDVYNNATQAGPGNTASSTITWNFPSSVFAFGADFFSATSGRLTLSGDFDGTGSQTLTVFESIGGSDGFLGVVGQASFNSIVFGNNTTTVDSFSIDNASFASGNPTTDIPESNAVVALALVGGSLLLSKKRKS
jgi:hypothetical protein